MGKKYELKANTKNLLSDVVGIIKLILKDKRGEKVFHSFEDTFTAIQERVHIPPELWKPISKGVPKWQQAVRNAAKPHRDKKTPDALTQHELIALVHGGFAMPNHVPDDREAVKFPEVGGFKGLMPKKKAKKKAKAASAIDATVWADIMQQVISGLNDNEQLDAVIELCNRYNFDMV